MSAGHWKLDEIYHMGDDVDTGPSISRLAMLHDSGKACGDCGSEFTAANGVPSSCETCCNMGSEYPLTQHPEVNTEAHKQRARQRRKAKESKRNG
jgi:hypothetical protein